MNKNPNPQGKGLTPVLDSLRASRALVTVPAKDVRQISHELFTSLFVLHSRFQFKPVVHKTYYLYRQGNVFRLSLIAPQEWGGEHFGQYVGESILQKDMTWTLALDTAASRDTSLMALIEYRRMEFEQALRETSNVGDVLPFYCAELPFYQRVFASGLACSLKTSLVKSGLAGLSYAQAVKRLE